MKVNRQTELMIASMLAKGASYRCIMNEANVGASVVKRISKEVAVRLPDQPLKVYNPDFNKAVVALRKGPLSLEEIAEKAGAHEADAYEWVQDQQSEGINLYEFDGKYQITKTAPHGTDADEPIEVYSDRDNTFTIGAMGDTHLGSKYERLDVLNDLYQQYEDEGVTQVFHAGNWIDGEARFNKFDLKVHGMDAQLSYLVEQYPRVDTIKTYAISGDDHEGWYEQREGVNIGRHAERMMIDAGRDDWCHLGFMEAYVRLVNKNTGAYSYLHVVHPGGGSAYATSYTVQKIVESYGGGEKPSVLLAGHYHKMELINIRNVWTVQTGCTQDQTPFMRKKRLEAHVGGHVLRLKQDPQTGAIVEMNGMKRYFNVGYYNGRWSKSNGVVQPRRVLGGVA